VAAEEGVSTRAYTPSLRIIAVLVGSIAVVNLLELAGRTALDAFLPAELERAPLHLVVRRVFFLSALPWLLFRAVRAFCAAAMTVAGAAIVIRARWGTVEIPRQAVTAIRRWRLPLPEPGFDVVMPSGRVGLSWTGSSAVGGPQFADMTAGERIGILHRPWLKLGLVPGALTFILFRLHQRIAFGDLFGEAQLLGWRRWLQTLTGVALSTFCMLLVIAVAIRFAVEVLALAATRLAPPWAGRARILLEVAAAVVYYGGLLAVLVLRLGL
jgi:hypothetical protein